MMDDLFPAFIYVVVRASVLQLGSEINFITDFIQDSRLENGKFDFAFTTLTVTRKILTFENKLEIVN